MFDPNLMLETKRLLMKVPSAGDFDGFCQMMADTETAHFVGGQMNRAQCWRAWCTMIGAWYMRGYAMFSVYLKDGGEWIGRIGPWNPESWPAPEVGWGLHPAHGGKGYALEASAASLDYVFDVLGWDDVIHIIDPENLPSIALAKRLGSSNRGRTQMPAPFDEAIVDAWGQTRSEWQENRKSHLGLITPAT